MAQKIRLWEVADENVVGEVPSHAVALEAHLEKWLESNVAMLDDRRRPTTLIAWSDRSDDGGVRNWRGVSEEEKQGAMGLEGVFRTTDEVSKFAQAVQTAARNRP